MDFPQQEIAHNAAIAEWDCCGRDIRLGKLEQAGAGTLHGESCNPLDYRGLLRPRAEQQRTATNSLGPAIANRTV